MWRTREAVQSDLYDEVQVIGISKGLCIPLIRVVHVDSPTDQMDLFLGHQLREAVVFLEHLGKLRLGNLILA